MSGSSNLPPGVTDSMIPGNTGNDAGWENLFDWMKKAFEGWDLSLVKDAVFLGKGEIEEELEHQETPYTNDIGFDISQEDVDLTVVHMHGYHSRDDEVRELKGEINSTADMLLECLTLMDEEFDINDVITDHVRKVLGKVRTYLKAKWRLPR